MPRLLFAKTGNAVWISHLDLMRVFQRPSGGAAFSFATARASPPGPNVSIALPLPVGQESVCELLDFDLAQGVVIPLEEIPARLNATLPSGLHVLAAWPEGRKLRELTHLDAALTLEYDRGFPSGGAAAMEAFFREDTPLPVPKRTKSGMTELDIRPMICSLSCRQTGSQTLELTCRVCAQNPSLNPMLLAEALRLHCPGWRRICQGPASGGAGLTGNSLSVSVELSQKSVRFFVTAPHIFRRQAYVEPYRII